MTSPAELAALFSENPVAARGIAAAYQALFGGVPTADGFAYLIETAVDTNYGSLRNDIVFNSENVFINLTNSLVQGNGEAAARFDALTGGTSTLGAQIEALYRALVPSDAQSAEGLAYLTRPDALAYYEAVAEERGVAGPDGAAVVALAALLKILVDYDLFDIGDDVNDLFAAVVDGTARLGSGLVDIDIADGDAHDGDERDIVAPTVAITTAAGSLEPGESVSVRFDFSERVSGFDATDLEVTGGTLSGLVQSAEDPTVYTAIFTAGVTPGIAAITLSGVYEDLAGNDGGGGTAIVRVRGDGAPVNTPPVAVADRYALNEDTTLTVEASAGVLVNDSDGDGDTLSAILVNGPAHGSLTFNSDGTFSYTPDENYFGADSFTYRANDGTADGNTVTVNLTVNGVNDAPVALKEMFEVDEDTTLAIDAPGLLANDRDADGDALTVVLVNGPANGTLTLNADGSFTYVPNDDYSGQDSFSYKVSDGSLFSTEETVQILVKAVNDAPAAVADSYSGDENQGLVVDAAAGVLSNDSDTEGAALSAELVSDVSHGTLQFNADGSFSYAPDEDYVGTDSFSYRAFDGSAYGNTVTVTLTVNNVNEPPVAVADSYAVDEDEILTIDAAGVLANDSDNDGDALTAVLVTGPQHGSLTLNPDGSFSYTPDGNYVGADSFTYKANDGTADGNAVTVSLTVNAVNDAPVAAADSYSFDEGTTLTVTAANGLLANDSDVDGNALTAVLVSGPAQGSLTLMADGSFTYTPDENFSGTASFTYKVNDGTVDGNVVTVSLTVNPVNDAPVAVEDSYSVEEDGTLTVNTASGVLANDTDLDGDTLSAVLVDGPANGSLNLNADGSFTYTPGAGYSGTDSFTYKVNDGTVDGNTVTVNLAVTDTNDVPAAIDDSYVFDEGTTLTVAAANGLLANDSDADNDPLTVSLVSGPAHGSLTLSDDGSFIYAPDENFFGSVSFTYRVNDGTANGNVATVNLTVNPVNDAPVAVEDSYTVNEDETLTVAIATGVLANDSDVEGDPLTAILVDGPSHGSLTLNSDGSFAYTPEADFFGPDSFTYKVNDGTNDGNTVTVNLTVNPVNEAPVAVDDSYTTDENQTLTISAAAGVLANDSDINGDPLTAILVAGPTNGNLSFNADGSFSYTPTFNLGAGEVIEDSFTYKVNDGTVDGNTVTVTLTVNGVNDAPISLSDVYQLDEDSALTTTVGSGVLTNDYDLDNDPISATLVSGPENGTLTFNADGSFTYTPVAGYHGTDSFTYIANDGTANGNVATVTLIVEPVNDTPVAVGDSYSVAEDTMLIVPGPGVLANDSDPDAEDMLSAVLVSGTSNGALNLSADGSFVYTPNAGFNGTDSFTYKVNDGTEDGNTVTVSLTVGVPNVAPVASADSYFLSEEGTLTVPAGGVLANDTDANSDPLAAELVSDVSNGTLTLNADGSFTYVPNANFAGRDSFTYRPYDGAAYGDAVTVTLNVANTGTAHPTSIDLDNIAAGNGGFRIVGPHSGSLSGWSVSSIGDFDGDGRDDVIVGSLATVPYSHVVFGAQTQPANVNLGALAGIGFGITPQQTGDQAGLSVSTAGDVNGDGYDDFIIGSVYNNQGGSESGAAYVVFGGPTRPTSVNLNTIAAGTGGFKIIGQDAGDRTGHSVSAAGDLDGDGYGDVIVGAIYSDAGGTNSGAACVIYGSANPVTVNLDNVSPGPGGFKIIGEAANNQAGVDVSSAGDVNGDGYDDLIVGAQYNGSGAAYVVFGAATRPTEINLGDIAAGTGGFKILGGGVGGLAGSTVSSGDFDGDGYDDLLIGAPFGNTPGGSLSGAAFVVYGSATPTNVDLGAVTAGIGGFRITGENADDWAGWSVSTAGDVNADGFDDIVVSARNNDGSGNNSGAAYLVFGTAARPSSIDLDAIALGNGGFKILAQDAGDQAGISVTAAGDVNGDGFDDLIVGAYNADANGADSGAAYVIYGGDWLV